MKELFTLFQSCTGVSTDSRRVGSGNLFFALRGENFDGNQFAREAIEKGAAYAVVDDPSLKDVPGMVWVPDALLALQQLATHYRRQFNFPVLAITGSNGKTTTKELITQVLKQRFRVHATSGNLNNHIGVPLTLLSMPADTEIAVIEMGANHQREIARLSEIAEPTHGLITNIGKAHLEGFGGIEGVKKGKGELYQFLEKTDGVVFVNRDESFLTGMSAPIEKRIFYGLSDAPSLSEPDYQIKRIRENPTVAFSFLNEKGELILGESRLSGRHNLSNIATAVTIGRYFKVPAHSIVAAIEDYVPHSNRSEWMDWKGNRVFLDAYNANPTSMRKALESFAQQEGQPRWVVLGGMLELGEYADQEHEDLLAFLLQHTFEKVILVGKPFSSAAQDLTPPHQYFEAVEPLRESWEKNPPHGKLILIKGSRLFGLEKLVR